MERGSIEQAGSPSRYVPLRDDHLAELVDLVSLTVQTLDLLFAGRRWLPRQVGRGRLEQRGRVPGLGVLALVGRPVGGRRVQRVICWGRGYVDDGLCIAACSNNEVTT
jgi:hypothetical protein